LRENVKDKIEQLSLEDKSTEKKSDFFSFAVFKPANIEKQNSAEDIEQAQKLVQKESLDQPKFNFDISLGK
jgi:hypothetical protein